MCEFSAFRLWISGLRIRTILCFCLSRIGYEQSKTWTRVVDSVARNHRMMMKFISIFTGWLWMPCNYWDHILNKWQNIGSLSCNHTILCWIQKSGIEGNEEICKATNGVTNVAVMREYIHLQRPKKSIRNGWCLKSLAQLWLNGHCETVITDKGHREEPENCCRVFNPMVLTKGSFNGHFGARHLADPWLLAPMTCFCMLGLFKSARSFEWWRVRKIETWAFSELHGVYHVDRWVKIKSFSSIKQNISSSTLLRPLHFNNMGSGDGDKNPTPHFSNAPETLYQSGRIPDFSTF